MLKQWTLGLFLSLILSTQAMAQFAFNEGVDYKLINPAVKTTQPDKVVVTELFWYGCPHCFRFEPYVERWSKTLPDTVVFEQVPSILNPGWANHARTYYSLKLMKNLGTLHGKIFDAIHIKRQRLDQLDKIAKFIGEQGVDEAKFRETFNSFPVDTLLRKNFKKESKYGHSGVPAVVINGKYLTSGSMTGSNERLIQVINFLIKKELSQ
ncbi:MAG: thiol:disulfide interchange protein DsbA/DsbL [Gammaproteobacteria bacterium]|nr:thiol:disulfide interchange protein DsbA/DsbL [Gammaproteobacteria bacterium]